MKKVLVSLFAFLMAMVLTISSDAALITFTDSTSFYANSVDPPADLDDYGWGDINKLDWTGDFVRWTHHFEFDPPALDVITGELTVWLKDDEADTWRPRTWDLGIGWGESGDWDFGDVDTGPYSYGLDASYLGNGDFTVTVASIWGDFYIDQSDLEITYEPIPEPGTMLLLGFGLLGLAGYGIRRKKKNS